MPQEQSPLVIVCSTAYLPAIGGAELAIHEIAKRSPSLRFLIVTSRFSRKVPRREVEGNIEIRRVGLGIRLDKWLLPLLGCWVALRRTRAEARAVLWGMMVSQGTLAVLFTNALKPRIPFVLTLQEGDAPEYLQRGRGGLIWFFWKHALARADRVTAISRYLMKLASAAGRRDVHLIPNGVDSDFFGVRNEQAIAAIRRKYRISDKDIVVLSVSRLVAKNGVDDLIRAFAIFVQTHRDAKLLLVGEGEERSTLETLARREGLAGTVIFAGAVAPHDIAAYFHTAHVFARPSRSEGLGIAFLEAMAAGIPVVATPVGGIVEFIEHDATGVLVEAGNREHIAWGLAHVVDHEEKRKELVGNALRLVREKYSWDGIARDMRRVLMEVL